MMLCYTAGIVLGHVIIPLSASHVSTTAFVLSLTKMGGLNGAPKKHSFQVSCVYAPSSLAAR